VSTKNEKTEYGIHPPGNTVLLPSIVKGWSPLD
jgi:hypothetical protein